MAKGFKHGAGGGTSLNFKVVGNPKPDSPKENTLWVDTDEEITSWAFAPTQPETAAEGMVWFSTDISKPIVFDALKKNSIMVYPTSAKQYVNGAWVSKVIEIYQNGEWVKFWDGVALNPSNPNDDVTGGWTGDSSITPYKDANRTHKAAGAAWNNGYVKLTMPYKSEGSYRTKNKVDVTRFNTLTVNAGYGWANAGMVHVFLTDKLNIASTSGASAQATIFSGGEINGKTVTLDISNVTGEQYIGFGLANWATQASATDTQIQITKVTLT